MATKMTYSFGASVFHWIVAVPLLGCVGTVLQAQQAPKEEKGTWMFRHKSLGLLTGMLVAPRLTYRFVLPSSRSRYHQVMRLPQSSDVEVQLGRLGHYALYAFATIMPVTGILMGYYGGKGLPFFYTIYDGAPTPNGAIAKRAFQIHKQVGYYGKMLIPLHAGAAVMHQARGQAIFHRINPFRKAKG